MHFQVSLLYNVSHDSDFSSVHFGGSLSTNNYYVCMENHRDKFVLGSYDITCREVVVSYVCSGNIIIEREKKEKEAICYVTIINYDGLTKESISWVERVFGIKIYSGCNFIYPDWKYAKGKRHYYFSTENVYPWDISLILLILREMNGGGYELSHEFLEKVEKADIRQFFPPVPTSSFGFSLNLEKMVILYLHNKNDFCSLYYKNLWFNGIRTFMTELLRHKPKDVLPILQKYTDKKLKCLSSSYNFLYEEEREQQLPTKPNFSYVKAKRVIKRDRYGRFARKDS